MQENIDTILVEYARKGSLYSAFTKDIKQIIEKLLEANGLRTHSITSRVKAENSLRKKLTSPAGKYLSLTDITDMSGIRIITYFGDEVDQIAKVIEREFRIDWPNSVDKRATLDPDRFGYLSLHYVVNLSDSRLHLTEYRNYVECKSEIQIRSILQHTWAEIEHDLGYKSKQTVPKEVRRRFSRLAGLLEIADNEFAAIRDQLLAYEKAVPLQLQQNPNAVSIDSTSIAAFIKGSELAHELDSEIERMVDFSLVTDAAFPEYLAKFLHNAGLETIADVQSALERLRDFVISFAEKMVDKEGPLSSGICLFFLCYSVVAESESVEKVLEYLKTSNIGPPHKRDSIAETIIALYREAKGK